jgi:serine protease inhibitor
MQFIPHLLARVTIIFSGLLLLGHFACADNHDVNNNTAFDLIKPVAEGNMAFAFDLYTQLSKESGNLFFSPYSLSTVLAMTYEGARESTAAQMAKVLHFPKAQSELDTAFRHLQDQIKAAHHKNMQLDIANALWGQKAYPFLDSFKDTVKKYYDAQLREVDFWKHYKKIHMYINAWVESKTHKKIKDLIKPGIINALTSLVLVNAIYFKGNWASPFEEKNTENAAFWLTDTSSVDVPMMTQKNHFGYMENDNLQMLELPYTGKHQEANGFFGNELSMIILLPRARDGLARLENLLSVANFDRWLRDSWRQEVEVFLPKFQINTEFELSKTLAAMGMPDAFNKKSDFSGIDGTKDLYLSVVIHQAFVDVNEEGTEAAAATFASVLIGSLDLDIPPPTPIFRADHPFIFLIRHNSSGSILFMGRVVNFSK